MTRSRSQKELRDSELGWIGEIPFDWKVVPTKHVLRLVKRTVGENWSDHQLLSLTKQGVITRDIESNQGKMPESFDTYQSVQPGELIFCLFDVDETPRTVGLAKQSGMVTGAYDCFRTLPSLDHRFASWYFIAIDDGKRFRPLYSGLRKVVPKPRFLSAGFALPSLDEQRQIADYLDTHTAKIDTLIGKQEQLIETLAERRQTVISHAVTKGLDPNVPMKDSGIPSIGEVPQTWTIGPIKAFTESLDRIRVPLSSEERGQRQGPIPYYGASGVIDHVDDFLFDEDLVLVSEDGANLLNRSKPIAFVATGQYWVNNHAHILRPRSGPVSYWAHRIEHESLLPYATGSAQPKLTIEALMNIKVAVPSSRFERQKIVNHLDRETSQIDALSGKAREMIDVLKERRQALISAAVTGKIDVRGLA